MAYSVNWATKVITIPKADTVLVTSSPDVRSLDVTTLWQKLIDIQDGEEGITYLDIVKNSPPLTVAGVTLARVVEIINGYTITFENLQYAVNIIGGNSNLADKVNKNQVSVNTGNSAGFVQGVGSGLSGSQATQLLELFKLMGLDSASPLVVTSTSRSAGGVQQTIAESAGTVTVTRT